MTILDTLQQRYQALLGSPRHLHDTDYQKRVEGFKAALDLARDITDTTLEDAARRLEQAEAERDHALGRLAAWRPAEPIE